MTDELRENLREQCARAIFDSATRGVTAPGWDHTEYQTRQHYFRHVDAILSIAIPAMREECVASPWLSMETAPKNGTRLILCWHDTASLPPHVELGRFKQGTGRDSGWCNTYGHPFNGEPTHWMHLPPPPAIRALGEKQG